MKDAKRKKIVARMYPTKGLHKQDRLTLLRVMTNLQYTLEMELSLKARGET